jgi:arylformamidase
MPKTIFDISVPITSSTIVWPGDPKIAIRQMAAIADGAESNLSQIRMSIHTGTHIDAPAHFIDGGKTIGDIPLHKLIGEVLVMGVGEDIKVITGQTLVEHPQLEALRQARKVLFKTNNSKLWHTHPNEFSEEYVGIDTSGAEFLAKLNLDLIGIDYLSISPFHDLEKPHQILLAKGFVLLEGVDLSQVPAGTYQLHCLPLKLQQSEGAPARAILTTL